MGLSISMSKPRVRELYSIRVRSVGHDILALWTFSLLRFGSRAIYSKPSITLIISTGKESSRIGIWVSSF